MPYIVQEAATQTIHRFWDWKEATSFCLKIQLECIITRRGKLIAHFGNMDQWAVYKQWCAAMADDTCIRTPEYATVTQQVAEDVLAVSEVAA